MRRAGFSFGGYQKTIGGRSDGAWVNMFVEVQPVNLSEDVEAAMSRITSHKGRLSTDLQREELDLLKQLSIGQLKSSDAKSFVESIPTVDKLLPKPDIKALTQ
jgi:hypothetical protein